MNDHNYNTTNSNQESRVPAVDNRLRIVGMAEMLVAQAANSTPEDVTVRSYYQPSHPAVPAATETAISNIVELKPRTNSLPADTRALTETMPLPTQPTAQGEVVDMDQYRMAQAARENIRAA